MRSFFLLLLTLATPALAEPVWIAGRVEVPAECGPAQISLFPARSVGERIRLRLDGQDDAALASAKARADGWFEIAAPAVDLYRVLVEAKGCIPVEQIVAAGSELELPPASLAAIRPLEIRILDSDGRPAAGVPVVLGNRISDDRAVWPIETFVIWRAVERHGSTGDDGRLILPRGDPERWDISLWAPGTPYTGILSGERSRTLRTATYPTYRFKVRSATGHPLPGVLARWERLPLARSGPGGELEVMAADFEQIELEGPSGEWAEIHMPRQGKGAPEVVLQSPSIVRGRVLDAVSRTPLAGALVWSGGPPAVRSAADGTFAFPLRAGSERKIAATAAGHLPESLDLQDGKEPVLYLTPATEIHGTVSEAGGRPIAGVEVSATPADGGVQLRWHVRTWTAPSGRFRLLGLPAGAIYRLLARKEGYAPAVRLADAGSAIPAEIVLGQGGTLTGRVLDAEGHPLAGARVTLSPEASHPLQDVKQRSTATDGAGRFRFVDLGPGPFVVAVEHEGFLPSPHTQVEIPEPPRDVDLEDVTLEADSWIEGRVVDARGEPLPGAYAIPTSLSSASPEESRGKVFYPRGGETGPDGRFRIAGLRPGDRYDLHIALKGYFPGKAPDVEAPTREPLRIVLEAAPVLTGRVVGPAGEPISGARIRARLDEAYAEAWTSEADSASDGSFRMPVVEPGSVTVKAWKDGYRARLVHGIQVPQQGESGPIEIALDKGAVLEGRVLDDQGSPVPEASVAALREGPESISFFTRMVVGGRADGEGRYRLEGLEPGPHTVAAEFRGRRVRVPVEIRLGRQSLDLQFERTYRVTGRVIDTAGTPVPGATVCLDAKDDPEKLACGLSGMEGTFALLARAGDYRLIATNAVAKVSHPEPVHVADSDLEGFELRLAPDAAAPP